MELNKKLNKFQNYDLKESVGAFWIVMIIINISAYALTSYFKSNTRIGLSISDNDLLSMAGANIVPIFIYFMIYGILMYHEGFALAISFGVTRRNFYKSAIANNLLISLIFAIIQGFLQIIDKRIIESIGRNPIVEFGIFNTSRDNIFIIVLSLFALFLIYSSMSNLLGVLQYKFGYKFWIGFGIVALFGVVLENSYSFITNIVEIFSRISLWLESIFSNFTIFPLAFIIITICYTLGYLLMRRISIKK